MVEYWIGISGNPVDGFEYLGPWNDKELAVDCMDWVTGDWWVARVNSSRGQALVCDDCKDEF